MSNDGADLNMAADGAMKAVLGGEQPDRMSDVDFEQMIRTAGNNGAFDYGGCANRFARLALEYLEAHPEAAAFDAHGVYDALAANASPDDRDQVLNELTGFMVGWGVNAARHIMKLRPVPNPAIIEL